MNNPRFEDGLRSRTDAPLRRVSLWGQLGLVMLSGNVYVKAPSIVSAQ